ncbi:MAG TPA: M23 family metallopeptidase [Roseiarcus sp.]|nr:M23 family metallopeptidase [Roseiarcus sp.]
MLISHAGTALRRTERAQADLGHEPPIQGDDPSGEAPDRGRAPWRWVAGVTLSGLCGLALIGSALYLDLDRQSSFAARPEFVAATQPTEAGEHVSTRKGDRLVRPVDIVAAKQDYQVSQPMKVGDKEIVRARPYTLLSTTLTTTPTQFAAAVPPFDPLKTSANHFGKGETPPDALPPQDDTEVVFTSHDITPADVAAVTGVLSLAQAMAQVDEFVRNEQAGERRFTMAPQLLLMRTSRAGVDPLGALPYAPAGEITPGAGFPSLAVRMVPENVTSVARTVEGGADVATERLLRPRHGEPFDALLRENGATPAIAASILAAFGAKKGASPVSDGQKVILQFSDAEDPDLGRRIARVDIYSDDQLRAAVAVKDDGDYVNVARASGDGAHRASPSGAEGGLSLYQSLYQTALKQGLPTPVIEDFVHAFVNDVDFQRSAQPGDAMTAFVADADDYDPHAALLYAALTVRDQTFHYYRFRTPDDNAVDYYDENGRSTRKFLLRKPIEGGVITSPFGMRYHPILHFSRMHTGVDWGAPVGTPVLAAGNGVVIKAGWDSGYGRRVEIQHTNGYVTTYNHMSGFGRGVTEGVRVTQGQVIGYVGQTGLATGPHLHYEVIINGNFVDPMGIKLPRTREFDGRMLALFKKERDRIKGLMSQAPSASAAAPGPTAKVN